MRALLQLSSLRKTFGGIVAVNDVSFSLGGGEIVGLIGPNGSGKTTVLDMISGALSPSRGSVRFQGRMISGLPAHAIAHHGVARTFQLVKALVSLTVLENVIAAIAFGRRRWWGDKARDLAREKLAIVGLADRDEIMAGDLNYIDQKRLELARALAGEPRLLLLDEWLAGLNPSELQTGIGLILSLQDSGATILLVEHIMEAVRVLCPRCVVMNTGLVLRDGPTEEVLADPAVIRAYLGGNDA